MDGNIKVGQPHREWVDDLVDWCRASFQELMHLLCTRENQMEPYNKKKEKKSKGSWICIAPHCEKLASGVLRHGSHSFYAATTPHLPLPRKAFTRWRYH